MSHVSYQFVTNSSTSWLHEVRCNLCKLIVTRIGELPKSENDPIPRFADGALAGWASFSMRSTRPPPDAPEETDQDLWPRLDRDFCPSCANMVHDWLCSIGADIVPAEERYLDALGRPTQKANRMSFGPGIELCRKEVTAGEPPSLCNRDNEHTGDCSLEFDRDGLLCPICISHSEPRRRIFTRQELESHAVDQHLVRYSDGSTEPIGWFTERGWGRTYFPEVENALRAELSALEQAREDEDRARPRFGTAYL